MRPRAILLDVMGTLVREPVFDLPALFGLTWQELLAQKDPTAWVDFELGAIDEATMFERFFADRRAFDHAGLKACLVAGYAWLEGVEPLLAELSARGHALHALSNYSNWYELIEQKLGLARYLSWSFVSCDTGVRKPDREAYLGAARVLGHSPAELLFVDDRAKNVEAARDAGLDATVFRDAGALRDDLALRGLLG